MSSKTNIVNRGIELSIIVRVVGGVEFLRKCLGRLTPQIEGQPFEVIVPYDSTIIGVSILKDEFPWAEFVDLGVVRDVPSTQRAAHLLYDRRTAAGLVGAHGEIFALLEDYSIPEEDWCSQVLEAHQLPYGVIGGAVEHVGKGILNWAVYFLDFARYQLPLLEGQTNYLTDVNVSYKRSVLESISEVWAERYNEATVHWALASKGIVLWQRPQVVVREDRGVLNFIPMLAERFAWGRVFGYMRTQQMSTVRRIFYILATPVIPLVVIARIVFKVLRSGRNRIWLLRSLPLVIILAVFWCLGELAAYVTGTESSPKTRAPYECLEGKSTRQSKAE